MKLHSIIDLITNSSTEIYSWADRSSVTSLTNAVNELLKTVGSDKTFDDLFTTFIEYADNLREDWEDCEDKEKYDNDIEKFADKMSAYDFPYTSRLVVRNKETLEPVKWSALINGVYYDTAVANY